AEMSEAVAERIEDAAIAFAALGALLDGGAIAEHAFKDDLGVQLHGERLSGGGPGNGVGVGAAIALAAIAGVGAGIFDGQLHGRHQVFAADFFGDDLVNGVPGVNVGARRLLGLVGAQEGGSNPVIGAGGAWGWLGGTGVQPAEDDGVIAERLKRLPVERKSGFERAFFFGDPITGRHAVGHKAS